MKKFLLIVLSLMLVFMFSCSGKNNSADDGIDVTGYERMTLEKQSGKDYKILQLTDIQIIDVKQLPYEGRLTAGDIAKWPDRDTCAFNLIRELVSAESPDFIVLTGDNVYGQFDGDGSNFKALVDLMDSFDIPWSFVNGNHDGETVVNYGGVDYECGKGMKWQAEYVEQNTENCLYELGAETMGSGNFTVNLTENGKIAYTFVMMDTHGCDMAAGMNAEQIDWYESEIRKASKVRYGKGDLSAGVVPSFMFFHHPMRQHYLAMLKYSNTDRGFVSADGKLLNNGDYGANMESVAYFQSNALWERIQELNSTKGVFVGHNHCNNTSIMYEGVRLTFGNKTGTYDSWYQQGGTRITIKDGTGDFTVEPIYSSGSKYGNR
ncbi:MAG: metallophosphoesterase [Clostridia bacterium]|nr:metallophosphoesterase [Clostridia bacterium]